MIDMKKRIMSFGVLLFSFAGLSAQSPIINVNGIYYRLTADTTKAYEGRTIAVVTTLGKTDYYKGEVSIPATVSNDGKEYPVTAIGDMAFKGSRQLTSITIPSSITKIPSGAFYGCEKLSSIIIAADNPVYDSRDNCNAVIERASNTIIAGCNNTIIPTSVTGIDECAFYGCSGLTSLIIPDNVTNIDRWAFLDCTDLSTITLPSGITSLSDGVFMGCNNLTFEIPSSITEIGTFALYDLGTLLWNSNTRPPVSDYHSLIIGDSVTSINWNMPGRLTKLHIPSSVKSIRKQGYLSLYQIEELYWNSKVSLNALGGIDPFSTPSLKTIVFGDSVEYIDLDVFFNNIGQYHDNSVFCNLESITVEPGNPYYDSRGNCNAIIESATRTVDSEGVNHNCIKDRLILGCMNTVIPDDVSSIGKMAFHSAIGLKSTNLPTTLTSIGDYSFYGSGLTTLNIPSNVTSIGDYAFSYCGDLESITVDPDNTVYDSRDNCNAILETSSNKLILTCKNTRIPDGITSIGSYAFAYRNDLESITIPSSVTSIGDHAFLECYSLKTVNIPSGVQRIEEGTFQNCVRLTSIDIPESVQSFGPSAFEQCINLTSLNIPSGTNIISSDMFCGCEMLTSVNIPSSVKKIDDYAFSGCSSLREIVIPNGVTSIGYGCFKYCDSLSYISLPSSVSQIDKDAFLYCNALETAGPRGGGYNYEFDWDTIPKNAFYNLKGLKSVYIPKTVNAVYESETDEREPIYVGYSSIIYGKISGYSSGVFFGCDNLESISVSFKNTKLFRFWRDTQNTSETRYEESPMDFNLYRLNPIRSITILDDSITDLSSILMDNIKTVVISEKVKYIDPGAFKFLSYTTTVPFYFDYYNDGLQPQYYEMSSNLERISVESGNRNYSSLDGVLFNKNVTQLLLYPSGRKGNYTTPLSVSEISDKAFSNCHNLSKVVITPDVRLIGERAFESCHSLSVVEIDGAPEIGLNAFSKCYDIQEVWTRSAVPGLMNICDAPQAIVSGDYSSISHNNISLTPRFDSELGREITEISGVDQTEWECLITICDIPSGIYNISMGIIPNPNGHPNIIHPKVSGRIGSKLTVLHDSIDYIEIIDSRGRKRRIPTEYCLENDTLQYDSLVIANKLEIPLGCNEIVISLKSKATVADVEKYASTLLLDRIFMEPVSDGFREESYAGTFTENVFNDATLYIPEGSKNTYRAANGWKLFKNIAINTSVDPVKQSDKQNDGDGLIYDVWGRRVMKDSFDQLQPGLYIINGKKYLKM